MCLFCLCKCECFDDYEFEDNKVNKKFCCDCKVICKVK